MREVKVGEVVDADEMYQRARLAEERVKVLEEALKECLCVYAALVAQYRGQRAESNPSYQRWLAALPKEQ